jgi:hypothetical protein
LNSYINANKKKQWTLWILGSFWIFLSSMGNVCLLSRAISLCTYTITWSEQALCLKSSYNMWILLWLWKFVVYVILQCFMFVWLYNNMCATCIGEINICFIIWICYNRYKKVLQTMWSFVPYCALPYCRSVTRTKKNVTTEIIVTLDKCSCRQVDVLQ